MKKQFLFLLFCLFALNSNQAQTRGTKIGYIDMEYILQNVPDYKEAQNQLEQKTQDWKKEIEAKKVKINILKEALKAEKPLLTKELIEERESEINFLESENLDYQQKRFGPNGDLMIQKTSLAKPIQDQVFTAVQDIAEAKKYDFIFDKTSDLTMLFAEKRFDISEQVLRILNRTEKREQLSKKQLKEEEAKEVNDDNSDDNSTKSSRQKILEEKKAARDKVIADRKELIEQRKKEAEDRKKQILIDRENKNDVTPSDSKTTVNEPNTDKLAAKEEAKQRIADQKAKILEDRKKVIEDRKNALEEKRKQVASERETKKNAITTTPVSNTTVIDTTNKEEAKTTVENAKQKLAEEKAKALEERKKAVEDQKKAIEEKRKQVLQDREAKKTGTVSETKIKEDIKIASPIVTDSTKTIIPEKTPIEDIKQKQLEARAKILEERKKMIEDNKKALEEKRKKILEDREAAKKANEEKLKTTK